MVIQVGYEPDLVIYNCAIWSFVLNNVTFKLNSFQQFYLNLKSTLNTIILKKEYDSLSFLLNCTKMINRL